MKIKIIKKICYFIILIISSLNCIKQDHLNVTSSIPFPGQSGVLTDEKIIIVFNKKVDSQKCISSFNIQPSVRGFFEYSGNIIKFTPSTQWENGTTYVFSLSQTCEDSEGVDLNEPYYASFAVGSELDPPSLVENQEMMGDICPDCRGLGDRLINDFQTDVCYLKEGLRFVFNFSEPMDQANY